ncbi:MAG TPA: TetR/AcrR family transcriptional regulator, partial [Polyangiaceae bacterium]|nr:TetR/AcrR family transcriptional regulator [Polyangiaceae bacterium]
MSVPETSDARRTYMRADDRRAQILACARDVFAERGFHTASIADICARAGIGRGTLYQYFGNKHDVLVAVVDELADRVRKVIAARPKTADIEGIDAAPPRLIQSWCTKRLRDLLEAVFADAASLQLMVRDRGLDVSIDEAIRRIDEVVLGALVADLRIAHQAGVFNCPEPELTALFILGGVEKMCLAALEADEPVDRERIVTVAIRLQLFG